MLLALEEIQAGKRHDETMLMLGKVAKALGSGSSRLTGNATAPAAKTKIQNPRVNYSKIFGRKAFKLVWDVD